MRDELVERLGSEIKLLIKKAGEQKMKGGEGEGGGG